MNLNNPNQYKVIIFKKKIFYTLNETLLLRDVFMRFTKDGVKPNLGIQEIFLLSPTDYELATKNKNIFKRELLRQTASHSFTTKGYLKNKKNYLR